MCKRKCQWPLKRVKYAPFVQFQRDYGDEGILGSGGGGSGAPEPVFPSKERLISEMTSDERKGAPLFEGCINYFPDALAAVAAMSKYGNDKHNPGEPLHWAREKSTDHKDCVARHLAGTGTVDAESGFLHDVGLAWRALANLQLAIEARRKK